MRQDAEADTGPTWAADDEPRITRVGAFMRKSRLDEIPQLWNVLRGDMRPDWAATRTPRVCARARPRNSLLRFAPHRSPRSQDGLRCAALWQFGGGRKGEIALRPVLHQEHVYGPGFAGFLSDHQSDPVGERRKMKLLFWFPLPDFHYLRGLSALFVCSVAIASLAGSPLADLPESFDCSGSVQ